MIYGIVRDVIGSPQILEIPEDEYLEIVQAKRSLFSILQIEEKFDLFLANFADYESHLLDLTLRRSLYDDFDWSGFHGDIHSINRRLVNLLSSGRLYVDHAQHDIGEIFGKESPQEKELKQTLKETYDDNLGYRVAEALRNYVQHRALPVHNLSFPYSQTDTDPSRKIQASVVPAMNTARLQEDGKFKKAVLKELLPRGNELNITPFIRQYVAGLSDVHLRLRELNATIVTQWDDLCVSVINRAREHFGTALGAALVSKGGPTTGYDERHYIIEDISTRRKELERKNGLTRHVSRFFVSGLCDEENP